MRKRHIKPIAGVEVRDEDTFLYLLLARNLDGLDGIHQFLSKHVVTKKSFPVVAENLSFLTIFLMAS
jgi:DNA polymerase-3 subunit alpha